MFENKCVHLDSTGFIITYDLQSKGVAVNYLIRRLHTVILFYFTATASHFPLARFIMELQCAINDVLVECGACLQVEENHCKHLL